MFFETNKFHTLELNSLLYRDTYSKYSSIFNLCEEINKSSQNINIEIPIEDTQAILALASFYKISDIYQTSILLCRYGLCTQAMILTRTALEYYFVLKCLIKDKNYVDLFIDTDSYKKGALLNKLSNNNINIPGLDENINSQAIYETAKYTKRIDVLNWAKMADEKSLYDLDYNILSNYVHPDIRILEQNIIRTQGEANPTINPLPDVSEFREAFYFTINVMLKALEVISEFKQLDLNLDVKHFRDSFNSMLPTLD